MDDGVDWNRYSHFYVFSVQIKEDLAGWLFFR
jgi:hypothetical protein